MFVGLFPAGSGGGQLSYTRERVMIQHSEEHEVF